MIRATPNGHAFEYADGTPYFLLGDTWWATFFQDPRFQEYNVAPNYVTASAGQDSAYVHDCDHWRALRSPRGARLHLVPIPGCGRCRCLFKDTRFVESSWPADYSGFLRSDALHPSAVTRSEAPPTSIPAVVPPANARS